MSSVWDGATPPNSPCPPPSYNHHSPPLASVSTHTSGTQRALTPHHPLASLSHHPRELHICRRRARGTGCISGVTSAIRARDRRTRCIRPIDVAARPRECAQELRAQQIPHRVARAGVRSGVVLLIGRSRRGVAFGSRRRRGRGADAEEGCVGCKSV